MSKNDITGDAIKTKAGNSDKFNEGFDRIWSKTITCARCGKTFPKAQIAHTCKPMKPEQE